MIKLKRSSRKAVIRIKNLKKLTQAGIEHAMWTSAKGILRTTSKEILRKPKGGRTYIRKTRSGQRRRHVASSPGETHANMTGALRRSMGFDVGRNTLEFGYGVESRSPAPDYAEIEFGFGNVKARPSLKNGIKGERRNFQANFDREIGKRLGDRAF